MKNRNLLIAMVLVLVVATANLVMVGTRTMMVTKKLKEIEYQLTSELVPLQAI